MAKSYQAAWVAEAARERLLDTRVFQAVKFVLAFAAISGGYHDKVLTAEFNDCILECLMV